MASKISWFNPLWFLSLGYLKDKVFRAHLESLNVPPQRIITECNLRENRDLIRRFVQHMESPADTCVQSDGGYVEGNL